ncbi:hypothetical protein PG994_010718 [Apiospora phragmitis]|uniref:Uncharacterized protein n=1 Tax=Apiospora phragmitis TaxID=2905665 RepID=A0ABR1TQR5_9PEZI
MSEKYSVLRSGQDGRSGDARDETEALLALGKTMTRPLGVARVCSRPQDYQRAERGAWVTTNTGP